MELFTINHKEIGSGYLFFAAIAGLVGVIFLAYLVVMYCERFSVAKAGECYDFFSWFKYSIIYLYMYSAGSATPSPQATGNGGADGADNSNGDDPWWWWYVKVAVGVVCVCIGAFLVCKGYGCCGSKCGSVPVDAAAAVPAPAPAPVPAAPAPAPAPGPVVPAAAAAAASVPIQAPTPVLAADRKSIDILIGLLEEAIKENENK